MIQLIQAATSSQSNQERKQAEKTLLDARQQNIDIFFQQAIEIFASSETPLKIREAAGTLIAVTVVAKNAQNEYYWDSMNGNTKNNVKNTNLGVLIDPERLVRRAAANIVSAICYIELPRKQWDGIVQKICANVSYDSQIVKQASILTLGFICSRMKQKSDFKFSVQSQQNILSGIMIGLQQTQPLLVDITLKALRDSIGSFGQILQNQQVRTYTLKKLGQIINSDKYTLDGLQILAEFVKVCYEYLGPYIQSLIQILNPITANSKNEENCIATIQVWENLAAQYKDLSDSKNVQNYITGNNGQLIVTSLLQKLSAMEDEDQSDDNPISDSASKALETIFENGSTQYKQLVLQFVKISISQNDWKHRQASIKAFSLLLYGLSDQENETLISVSINELIGLLSDSSKQVQLATLDSLTIITQVCGKIILKSQHFLQYLKVILNKISISEKFLRTVCKILDNLCHAQKQSKLGKFTAISDDLMGILLKYALANQSPLTVINYSTTTILNILEVANNQAIYRKYIAFVLQNFDNISQVKQVQKRTQITSAFFCIIQFSLHGLKNHKLEDALIGNIYTKVVNIFKTKSDVDADGLYAIEALVPFFEGNLGLVNDFWAYIIHSLQKWQDFYLFRSAMSCIASFINSYGQLLGQKLDTFVPQFIELLQNPNFPKQLKLQCMIIIGEVFLLCGKAGIQYLQKFLDMIVLCCSAAIQLAEIDFSYSQQLKDHILQALMCIVHGLSIEQTANQIISPYIPKVLHFIMLSSAKKLRPTVSYIRKCVLLMADFFKVYPQAVKPYKKEQFIADCVNTLKNYNKNRQYDSIIKYAELNLR